MKSLRIDILYAIIAHDTPASQECCPASRPTYLARLEWLKKEDRLVFADPHPTIDSNDPDVVGFIDSLTVAEFGSLAAAQNWAEADPYRVAGMYAEVVAKPFRGILP